MTREPHRPVPWPARAVSTVAAEATYRVRFDEAGPDGLARPSTLLRYAQDVAWIHSESLGFDRAWYASRGLAWVVRSVELVADGPIRTGDVVVVRTQVVGFRKVWARRRTEVRAIDADRSRELIAWLQTDWVMTDHRGTPTRVPPEIPALFGIRGEPYTPLRVDLPEPPGHAARHPIEVRPRDLDPMGHANNAIYLDWAEEVAALVRQGRTASASRRARLEYVDSARPDDVLAATAWELPADGPRSALDGSGKSDIAVRIRQSDGADVLRAVLGD